MAVINGTSAGETLNGTAGSDTITGAGGADTIAMAAAATIAVERRRRPRQCRWRNRAARVSILDKGASVEIAVDTNGDLTYDLAVATLKTADAITIGQDIFAGT